MQRRRDDLVGIPLDPSPVLRIFLGYRLASRRCLQEEHPMTNRLLVIITAIVAVVGFGTATFLYEPTATKPAANPTRSEEHTSELQSLMRISYAVFCLKKNKTAQLHKTNKYTKYKTT